MIKKHPHKALIRWYPEPSIDPGTGIQTDSPAPIEHEDIPCRFEPAGDAQYKSAGGVTSLHYGFRVYMDLPEFTIPENAVVIRDLVEMSITRVDPYQKHLELWL